MEFNNDHLSVLDVLMTNDQKSHELNRQIREIQSDFKILGIIKTHTSPAFVANKETLNQGH
jgi:hypothetical protein